ncbi:hypothetical protein GHT89_16435 [Acinetobacter baumannii]|uniref:hypothetical protein n=1 Tax=Acinetobacter baumannii TaxID=470 RepID=UPI00387DCDB2
MNTERFPKSKLEKALNLIINLSLCIGVSAFLVGVENFSFHYKDMGNLFMTLGVFSFFFGLIICFIKLTLSSYLTQLGFRVNCRRGIHFGKLNKFESDHYAKVYGKCFCCNKVISVQSYKIEFNEIEYFLEASNMIEAIRRLQEKQNIAKSLGTTFTVTDLNSVSTRVMTYIVKENDSLDIKR